MMKEKWLNENLCSFDEKTRIELGPQLIELECNDANLRDEVTSPHYRIGERDALGKIIMREAVDSYGSVQKGETMTCVDWRCKHLPKVWKIYKWDDEVGKFVKVGEDESRDDALDFARTLAGEM